MVAITDRYRRVVEKRRRERRTVLLPMRVTMDDRPRAFDVVTLPYPGFPTDLQPMVVALNAIAEGTSMITAQPPWLTGCVLTAAISRSYIAC